MSGFLLAFLGFLLVECWWCFALTVYLGLQCLTCDSCLFVDVVHDCLYEWVLSNCITTCWLRVWKRARAGHRHYPQRACPTLLNFNVYGNLNFRSTSALTSTMWWARSLVPSLLLWISCVFDFCLYSLDFASFDLSWCFFVFGFFLDCM